MLGVIGSAVAIFVDLILLIIILMGLFIVEPIMALTAIVFFTILGLALYLGMTKRAKSLGNEITKIEIESNEKILEVLYSYRELVVKNRRDFYSDSIKKSRLKLANLVAEQTFMPNISKYVFESGTILGALIVSFIQFLTQDATSAVASISVFLAASSRLAPAVLRIQTTAVHARVSTGSAGPTLYLINEMANFSVDFIPYKDLDIEHKSFVPDIKLQDINFSYVGNAKETLKNINLDIKQGEIVAIVGPSGAGKTTLVDVLLGIISPDSGDVRISGFEPLKAIEKWPGSIAYVPQDVMVSNCSIRDNVGLGYSNDEISDDLVEKALKVAHLYEHVMSLPEGLETNVGDRGTKLSGGQRQRLGIARALFTKPKLLVLDEATSSLDGQSESDITDSINDMRGEITVILIAHRLSTVKNADKVVYLESGKVLSVGSFEEVRRNVPNFEKQASLMGL
jgi:ABC-type branched-subunit amino acid transport system ATPase component